MPGVVTKSIGVVMACHTVDRWPSIARAIESVQSQTLRPHQFVVAVDHNPSLAERLRKTYRQISVVENNVARGASATRNAGAGHIDAELIAFIDDDEVATPEWLDRLVEPFANDAVVGTGGRYRPSWQVDKPTWFPDEFAWVVGGHYLGMPESTSEVRNVWSGNMAIRSTAFRLVGGFRTDFGKMGGVPQPEDTDLCIRSSRVTGGRWMYVPSAIVDHEVPADRSSFNFFVKRCYLEGLGKSAMQENIGDKSATDTERSYARKVIRRCFKRLASLRPAQVSRALAIVIGLLAAMVGFGAGKFRKRRPATSAVPLAIKPARIVEFNLTQPISDIDEAIGDLDGYQQVWVVTRIDGLPFSLSTFDSNDKHSIGPKLLRELEEVNYERLRRITGDHRAAAIVRGEGCTEVVPARTDVDGRLTVVICTHNRPTELRRALDSLANQTATGFHVLVIDNAPTGSETKSMV
ncbi:MAG: glycosyltransferase, partial [Nocardiaceae bacterium]|nr:glycosyltransferase [Nocardiaceae bacterium]